MSQPRSLHLPVAGHEIHVLEWGDPAAPALVMWHGLARVARDFDVPARHFSDRFRILCPDTIGRGLSTWSGAPDQDYTIPTYCAHAVAILDQLGVESCAWVGTSMGGIVGMALAGTPETAPRINRLVVNDIGPRLNDDAINRIKAYVSVVPEFATITEFERALRFIYAGFGPLSDEEWRAMAEHSARRRDNGRISSHFDPQVMRVFVEQFSDFDMWEIWDRIACPTLAIRGETSDLLEAPVFAEMGSRGPRPRLLTVPGCGHAPMLNTPDQLAALAEFLG